jgi:hypothetical protein
MWTKLAVSREAVRREWPFSLVTEEAAYTVIPDRPFRGGWLCCRNFPKGECQNT